VSHGGGHDASEDAVDGNCGVVDVHDADVVMHGCYLYLLFDLLVQYFARLHENRT
jgi:hypothetical protein